ncbi:hypothetical protein TeGR_g8946 [Tetraparma gracilis]|uniref:Uncharacterized protein n=1 Tax=Tetraparma gracilis TaxID=2962635 RepID=A0ABQ6MIL3_9STRA|nr:hypothetical protein TeGR_g8946 [Tetraparma gracilis]
MSQARYTSAALPTATVATGIPAGIPASASPPPPARNPASYPGTAPQSSALVFCDGCGAQYQLPYGCTSWRCQGCQRLQTTAEDECPCCAVQ